MKNTTLNSTMLGAIFGGAITLILAGQTLGNPSVSLLESNSWDNITVLNSVVDQVDDFTGIDLDDETDTLVVAVPGESADVSEVTFGGVGMTLAKAYNVSYSRVALYTLTNPKTGAGQTLSITASGDSRFDGGYSPQTYCFKGVDSIGDAPQAGRSNTGPVTNDFGSVTAGTYLLVTLTVNSAVSSFQSPAEQLIESSGDHVLGWKSATGGEAVGSDSASKAVIVSGNKRVAAIGLELIPPPPSPSGTILSIR